MTISTRSAISTAMATLTTTTLPPTSTPRGPLPYRTAVMMPTLAQLAAWRGGSGSGSGAARDEEEEGRDDSLGQQLVRDVRDAGGAAAVAAAVGLRAKRRPVGYWDNLDTLDEELALFVAAHWVELSTSDFGAGPRRGGGGSGKGRARARRAGVATTSTSRRGGCGGTRRSSPATLEIDDCGTRIRIEGGGEGRRRSGHHHRRRRRLRRRSLPPSG